MKVRRDDAWRAFVTAMADESVAAGGIRLKNVRSTPLWPGGRTRMTLFEPVAGGRPHPRLQFAVLPADDPAPPETMLDDELTAARPQSIEAAHKALAAAWRRAEPRVVPEPAHAPEQSPRYWTNNIRGQRTSKFFAEVRTVAGGWLREGLLPTDAGDALAYAIAELEDLAHARDVFFDDEDTGTYHSFGHDAPFVHYLEHMLGALPDEGSRAFASLSEGQQASVRRQRVQAQKHLDALMRHKYALHAIEENDIEPGLGGFLIDQNSRQIVSESVASRDSLVPRYERLRIDPGADHPDAGEPVYRDGKDLRLADHAAVEVGDDELRAAPIEAAELTFRRAPDDPHLRSGVRFDWDGNGYLQDGRIEWVDWAGHCDIKAVMEQLGVALLDGPRLTEYRSDTGQSVEYDRDLVLEMVASALEFGSVYRRADGTGQLRRGEHEFGGARNDSRPDRLQFDGPSKGRGFRWPIAGRRDTFTVRRIVTVDGPIEPRRAFLRYDADLGALDFSPNPRYLQTIEGDYNLIDVSGARVEARVICDEINAESGRLERVTRTSVVDLRETPEPAPDLPAGRYFLGTHVDDASRRRIFRVYLDCSAEPAIGAELDEHVRKGDRWVPEPLPGQSIRLPLAKPMRVTLSREMKADRPEMFRALVDSALRTGQNICADTDAESPVWNGAVTRLRAQRTAANPDTRVERWRVYIDARFGEATLDYLMRRDARGEPEAWCPVPGADYIWPDFLWRDVPDVGSKGFEDGDWIINDAMLRRGVIDARPVTEAPGGVYVEDDHIKNLFEMIFAALGGYPWSIVHENKRYGYRNEAGWRDATAALDARRARLTFDDQPIV